MTDGCLRIELFDAHGFTSDAVFEHGDFAVNFHFCVSDSVVKRNDQERTIKVARIVVACGPALYQNRQTRGLPAKARP